MRILVIHNRYRSAAPSGENQVVDQEVEALRSRGHIVEVFQRESDEIDGWSVLRKSTLPLRVVWNGGTRRDLADALRRFRPDVAHVHNTFPLLSASVLYACRDASVPVVATLHNYRLLCPSGNFFRDGAVCHDCVRGSSAAAIIHRCYRGSALATAPLTASVVVNKAAWRRLVSAYICISAEQQRLLTGLDLDPERVFVKHNLVPPPTEGPETIRHAVAYVGRLDEPKGIPLLMEAWDRYRTLAGDDALHLVIAGDGPMRGTVSRWTASRRSVRMAGLLDKVGCQRLVAGCRAVLLPSQWEETFGLVVAEAMSLGVPSIAAGHGSPPELITPGHDGELFRPGDPADLARAIATVDSDPARYERYGQHALGTYRQRFTPTKNIDRLVDIYRFAIGRPISDIAERAEVRIGRA